MSMNTSRWLLPAILTVVLGCSEQVDMMPAYPVTGTVTYQGRPMPKAIITFYPVNQGLVQVAPRGISDANGNYHLTTRTQGDGAPPGEYRVTIYWPEEPCPANPDDADPLPPDRLKNAYSHAEKSPLVVQVLNEQNNMDFSFPIE